MSNPSFDFEADHQLSVLGLRCPEPLMLMRKKMREIKVGELLLLITDDPATARDIPDYCQHMNQTLVQADMSQLPYHFLLKKDQ
ncbi:MAG: sulfurtransferase TusA [Shewanellaceae bacterium]|nr:sulfurtransferase TusA [Shewanellaceae bacterium]